MALLSSPARMNRRTTARTRILPALRPRRRAPAWGTLLHRFPERSGFDQKVQRAELEYLARSQTAQALFAENYVGLPY